MIVMAMAVLVRIRSVGLMSTGNWRRLVIVNTVHVHLRRGDPTQASPDVIAMAVLVRIRSVNLMSTGNRRGLVIVNAAHVHLHCGDPAHAPPNALRG